MSQVEIIAQVSQGTRYQSGLTTSFGKALPPTNTIQAAIPVKSQEGSNGPIATAMNQCVNTTRPGGRYRAYLVGTVYGTNSPEARAMQRIERGG